MQLRDYQLEVDAQLESVVNDGGSPVLVLGTGLGKTAVMAHRTMKFFDSHYQVATAHRQELVSQIAMAYAKFQIPHRIVAPPSVVQEARRAQLEDLGQSFVDQNSKVGVCSVDTVIAREWGHDSWARNVTVAHDDEAHHCFPAGAIVEGRPISSFKVGDLVAAFDESSGIFETRAVTHVFKNIAPRRMMRIQVAHRVIECTSGHPFLTKRGWINAGDLKDGDFLLLLPDGFRTEEIQHPISVGHGGGSLLRKQPLRVCVSNGKPQAERDENGASSMLGVRGACGAVGVETNALAQGCTRVLQRPVLRAIQIAAFIRDDGSNQSNARFRSDESQQSYESPRVSSQDESEHEGQEPKNSRGERRAADLSRNSSRGASRAFRVRASAHFPNGPQRPDSLQDRLRASVAEDSDRGRWPLTRHEATSSVRRPKRPKADWCRVESVEVYESADSRTSHDGFVYNLEIDGVHTYSVCGVVVHNCLRENKWGRAKANFPSLKSSIGYTATPHRADRKGIGAHASGFYTDIVLGPQMWQAMEWGYLTRYRLVTGKITDLDLTNVATSVNGDYNPQQMRKAVKQSRQIVGDAVETYRRFCPGTKAVAFAVDVEDATRYRQAFCDAGFTAEIVTAQTKPDVRRDILKRFKVGAIQILVNVDLFGEGFDLPAIECVILCRPTKSQSLAHQQYGRALRLMVEEALMKQWHSMSVADRIAAIASSAKPFAWILDLARNWAEPAVGGLPDARGRIWTMDDRAKGGGSGPTDVPPVRACTNPLPVTADGMLCTGVYERFLDACPFCGWTPVPAGRSIEQVDGDVTLVDDVTLARLRGEYLAAHTTPIYTGPHAAANYARHRERHEALAGVREAMEWWGPAYEIEQARKLSDREQMRAFYLTFGVTTLEAVSLKRADADALRQKILDWMQVKGFTIPA